MPRPEKEPEAPKKRRTPDEQHRDRLTARIAKLRADRDDAIREAVRELKQNAEAELRERIDRADRRITERFQARIDPLDRMLAGLGANGAPDA